MRLPFVYFLDWHVGRFLTNVGLLKTPSANQSDWSNQPYWVNYHPTTSRCSHHIGHIPTEQSSATRQIRQEGKTWRGLLFQCGKSRHGQHMDLPVVPRRATLKKIAIWRKCQEQWQRQVILLSCTAVSIFCEQLKRTTIVQLTYAKLSWEKHYGEFGHWGLNSS